MTRPTHLLSAGGEKVASFDASFEDGLWSGPIRLDATPLVLRALFDRFEELVNGQVFNLADEIEEEIASLGLRVRFSDGTEAPVADLQVFPRLGQASFKIRDHALNGAR